jgi:hypothetical protein
MIGTTTGSGVGSPEDFYVGRLDDLRRLQAKEQRWDRFFAFTKLAILVLFAGLLIWMLKHPTRWGWLLVPAVAFGVMLVLHERTLRSLRFRDRAIDFYVRGLARLRDQWAGTGEPGDRFLDPSHPYARDLDLFGKGSLFELLCTSRTRSGEETLAAWLLAVPTMQEIRARQVAVTELKDRVPFRERLWALGETVRIGLHPEALAAWGEGKGFFTSNSIRIAMALLALLWIASLICWGVWGLRSVALLMSVVNLGFTYRLHRHLEASVDAVEAAAKDLQLLSEVLGFLEGEEFHSPKLVELQASLRRDGISPSIAIKKLGRLVEFLESRRNWFVRAVDLFVFWSAQLALSLEDWRQEFGPAIRGWLAAVGELEALAALSGYAYEHPRDTPPVFVDDGPLFDAREFAHPLLPEHTAIRNDLKLGEDLRLIIVSGPNMAGKSTFMRAVGVNVVLAQCGAPVRAESLRLSRLAVAASICILDSLQGGVSRFYAEIRRLKVIDDLTEGPLPVLFLLDELLSGTNSHDRFIGTQFIVRRLVDHSAIGIVSTHDLALTQIPEAMGSSAINCHFEDQIEDGLLKFDYRLHPGIVQTSNALELMRSIGLKVGE